jgi:hypothetical protein
MTTTWSRLSVAFSLFTVERVHTPASADAYRLKVPLERWSYQTTQFLNHFLFYYTSGWLKPMS